MDTWKSVKQRGSGHYKTGSVEPIDLFRAGGILQPFAVASIIKYAFRQREAISPSDCDKIIHYAEILKALAAEETAAADHASAAYSKMVRDMCPEDADGQP